MLANRIIGAFLFRKQVYADVEKDASFTSTAWIIVVVVTFLAQLGARAHPKPTTWLVGALLGTLISLVAFALGVWIINLVGKYAFHADVNFNELLRTLGLAYVWNILGVFNAASIWFRLLCLPLFILGWILGLAAWFLAAKEALDLGWPRTILSVLLGWLLLVVAQVITGWILAILGFGLA
jgi:hypothetical protein